MEIVVQRRPGQGRVVQDSGGSGLGLLEGLVEVLEVVVGNVLVCLV